MQLNLVLVLEIQELLIKILLVDMIVSLHPLVMILVMYIYDNTILHIATHNHTVKTYITVTNKYSNMHTSITADTSNAVITYNPKNIHTYSLLDNYISDIKNILSLTKQ